MPFPADLPDLLVARNGHHIADESEWLSSRRNELLELFRTVIYGRTPEVITDNLSFEVKGAVPDAMGGKATRKLVTVSYKEAKGTWSMDFLIFVPNLQAKPVPAFVFINNRDIRNTDPDRNVIMEFWPAEELISRGYAAVTYNVGAVDPDFDDGFKNGVHGVFDEIRTGESWGTIAAWAWGASRVMDYLQTDADIDSRRIALVGHSRGGKTALWCGAEDERFAMVVSNESGSTGASISRNKKGETVAKINDAFPHWFCENYKNYGGCEESLPVDQHELLALIAPRLVYVSSAQEDHWSDPEHEFMACVCAEPAYRLFGLEGVGKEEMPEIRERLHTGSIGYHIREGKHDLTLFDWNCFMDFADKHLS